MNQRSKRSNKGKGNNLDGMTLNTGGHVAKHMPNEEPEVKVPQKVTGDIKDEKLTGLAKASPFFKKVKDAIKPVTQKEETKIIAKATVKKDDKKKKDEDEDK